MMKRALLLAAMMGMLAASVTPVMAQSGDDVKIKVGEYAPDLEAEDWILGVADEKVPSLAELRGLVVVVFFWVSWHEGGDIIIKFVNELEHNPQIGSAGGVYTIGITDANRKSTEPMLHSHKVFFPVGVKSKMAEEYDVQGGFGFVVIDAEGRLAYRGGGGDINGLASAIIDSLGKTPPSKTHPLEARMVRRLLTRAREYTHEGNYRRAFKTAVDAYGRAVTGDVLKTEVFDLIDLLEALGYERIDRAVPEFEAGDFADSARLLRSVYRQFPTLDAGKDAKKLYDKYEEESDGFREAIQSHTSEDEAAKLYSAAKDDVRRMRFGDGYDKLNQIVTDYADTEASHYASEMIDRMKANKDFWGYILDHKAEEDCELWLTQVRSQMRNHQYEAAKELLRRILSEYPDTIYEKKAREMLIEMP